MSFTPATQQGSTPKSGSNTYSSKTLVTKPQSGCTFATTRLSKFENHTVFRIIPSYLDGLMQTPLNPQFQTGAAIGTLIGPWAYNIEVCSSLGSPCSYTFISSVRGDSQGNVPEESRSPASKVTYACFWKIKEMQKRLQYHMDMTGQPTQWLKYSKGKFPFMNLQDPRKQWLVQGLCSQYDGNVYRDQATKQAQARPYFVLMFGGSLFENMADDISMNVNPDQPLTPATCGFGDFISPEAGHSVIFSKFAKKDPDHPEKRSKTEYKVKYNPQGAMPIPNEHCAQFFKPWEDILYQPTIEESIAILIEALGPDMVDFGLKDTAYAQYIPDAVSGTSAEIPATINTKEIDAMYKAGLGGQAQAPQQQQQQNNPGLAPGHPAGYTAPASGGGGGYAMPAAANNPADNIDMGSAAPTPPPFPTDATTDGNGQPEAATHGGPALNELPDLPSAGSFEDSLADVVDQSK